MRLTPRHLEVREGGLLRGVFLLRLHGSGGIGLVRNERWMNMKHKLREGVRRAYSAAAERPHDKHPFPVGYSFAESLGYPDKLLANLPRVSVDAFSGVSSVSVFAEISVGATVLDLGCGAGLDSLIAARKVGPQGRVISIDFSDAMLARARQAAAELSIGNLE